jgi:hypothetical protein
VDLPSFVRTAFALSRNPQLSQIAITLIDPANRLVPGKMGEQTAQACANA